MIIVTSQEQIELMRQAGRIAASLHDEIVDSLVNLSRGHAGLGHAHRQVQGAIVDYPGRPDGLNILLIVDDVLRWAYLSLEEIKLYLINPFIKSLMALLILLAAAAPAKVIS